MASAPLVADQRAALVGAVPALLVVAIAMGGATWPQRSQVRTAALVPLLAVVLIPVGVATVRAATAGDGVDALPLVARMSDTFGSTQKQQSAEIRLGLLRDGLDLARSRPILGHGLGQPVEILDEGEGVFASIGDFHNIALDLAVRTGLSGLLLFALACAVSIRAAAQRWRALADSAQAALVLAAGAALSGLLVKGLFETIFQKYRLAVLLGLLIGVIAAADRAAIRPTAHDAGDAKRDGSVTGRATAGGSLIG
jgi:O-antigen ligase